MCGIWWSVRDGAAASNGADADDATATMATMRMLQHRGPDASRSVEVPLQNSHLLSSHGTVLGLRGPLCAQPLRSAPSPPHSLLSWNGEVFGGALEMQADENDGTAVLRALDKAVDSDGVLGVLSVLRGPWSMAFWDEKRRRLWWGRDYLGRRSLLWRSNRARGVVWEVVSVAVHSPQPQNAAAAATANDDDDMDNDDGSGAQANYPMDGQWTEVPANGVFWMDEGEWHVHHLPWTFADGPLQAPVVPMNMASPPDTVPSATSRPLQDYSSEEQGLVHQLDAALGEAVRRRVQFLVRADPPTSAPDRRAQIAVMFSGGVDSMVLAALADRHVPADEPIDLLNVAFARTVAPDAFNVPDRLTARQGLAELRHIAPNRTWNFVEIDVTSDEVSAVTDHIRQLIAPRQTVLDLSIGTALWFAARGRGHSDGTTYRTSARVLLMGIGADEQLAGYGRHWTRFRHQSWTGLATELRMDLDRISWRNLGRDDRLISDHGREVRAPFLDEDVVSLLNSLPIWRKADMRLPRGIGDKLLLRRLAWRLGLHTTAHFQKRAIQFGSRIAKLSGAGGKGSDAL